MNGQTSSLVIIKFLPQSVLTVIFAASAGADFFPAFGEGPSDSIGDEARLASGVSIPDRTPIAISAWQSFSKRTKPGDFAHDSLR